jgi:feruloyl esterase
MRGGDDDDLCETQDFGLDPGNLRMLSFVPDGLPDNAPLVVVLHGCTQTAAGYDRGSGWSTLAARHGFALLYPEQRRCNNGNTCFNWFELADTQRGRGEVASIRSMIAHMLREHALDARKVFVTGLSAGGAMASALLATYPEVFAGGGIIAGLPYGCASGTNEAFDLMLRDRALPAGALGDRVRGASRHAGPWPSISVWHGTADSTVRPANAREIVKQWLNVHGQAADSDIAKPGLAGPVDGYPYRGWVDRAGRVIVECYDITGMAHGTPIATRARDADQRCGAPGPFMLDVGISSTFRLAQRWGLLKERVGARPPAKPADAPRPAGDKPKGGIDPARVIADALRAAGLLGRG